VCIVYSVPAYYEKPAVTFGILDVGYKPRAGVFNLLLPAWLQQVAYILFLLVVFCIPGVAVILLIFKRVALRGGFVFAEISLVMILLPKYVACHHLPVAGYSGFRLRPFRICKKRNRLFVYRNGNSVDYNIYFVCSVWAYCFLSTAGCLILYT